MRVLTEPAALHVLLEQVRLWHERQLVDEL